MLTAAFVFAIGLIVGSFLNVCIYRLPRGESVVHPRSHCPSCGKMVAGYDNIPVLSYLILGGHCRQCRAPISFVYPVVELFTGIAFALCYLWSPDDPVRTAKWAALSAALIVLIMTDLRERILPDRVTFPLAGAGLVFAVLTPVGDGTAELILNSVVELVLPWQAVSVADALLGALVGGGILFALGEAWYRLKGVEAMGFGDVKLMAMAGVFFGLKLTVFVLLVGSVAGSLIGGLYILASGRDTQYELPLGTFLGASALFAIFWGRTLVEKYLSLFPG